MNCFHLRTCIGAVVTNLKNFKDSSIRRAPIPSKRISEIMQLYPEPYTQYLPDDVREGKAMRFPPFRRDLRT